MKRDKKHTKLIGVKGNNDISKFLLKNINCNFQSELSEIKRQKDYWHLRFKDNKYIYSRNLILSIPFPQAKKLSSKFVKSKLFKT